MTGRRRRDRVQGRRRRAQGGKAGHEGRRGETIVRRLPWAKMDARLEVKLLVRPAGGVWGRRMIQQYSSFRLEVGGRRHRVSLRPDERSGGHDGDAGRLAKWERRAGAPRNGDRSSGRGLSRTGAESGR